MHDSDKTAGKKIDTVLQTEASTRCVPWKKLFLKISQSSQENTDARVSFLIKLKPWGLQNSQENTVSETLLSETQANKVTQRRIQGCCNIQDGVLCDNYYHKALHLGCRSSPRSASVTNISKYAQMLQEEKNTLEQILP